MPREEWKRTRKGRYLVKFSVGTYGRIQLDIDGSSDRSPLYMESWLSLKPGSRNLATGNMIIGVMESEEPDRWLHPTPVRSQRSTQAPDNREMDKRILPLHVIHFQLSGVSTGSAAATVAAPATARIPGPMARRRISF